MNRVATDEQIAAAVSDRSATDAKRHLEGQGLVVSISRCDVIISRMIASGQRRARSTVNGMAYIEAVGIDPDRAADGCRKLLAAQLRTGAHWINDPAQMRSAMLEAGMAA